MKILSPWKVTALLYTTHNLLYLIQSLFSRHFPVINQCHTVNMDNSLVGWLILHHILSCTSSSVWRWVTSMPSSARSHWKQSLMSLVANLPWAPASPLEWNWALHYNFKIVTEREKNNHVNSNTLCFIVNSNIKRGMGKTTYTE
jgi:hypothetical protein